MEDTQDESHKLWKVKDVAHFLCTTRFTVGRWMDNEEIPWISLGRGKKRNARFDPEKIKEWLKQRTIKAKI